MHVKYFFLIIILLFVFSSCAEQSMAKQRVEAEVQSVPEQYIDQTTDINRELIQASSTLTPLQKSKILDIENENREQQMLINAEIERTKVVMIQTILDPNMSPLEFRILKKKLLKLDKKRINSAFASISKVRLLLAPRGSNEAELDSKIFHPYVNEL